MWPFLTRKELTLSVFGLLCGITCACVGAHLSYTDVASQQAQTQARKEYVKARLRKLLQD